MSVSPNSFKSGWDLADRHLTDPKNNRKGLDQNEMANLAVHYKETGQTDKAAVLYTVLAGGKDSKGYGDLIDGNKDGLVQLEEMASLGTKFGSPNIEPGDFQKLGPERHVAGGVSSEQLDSKVNSLADDPELSHLKLDSLIANSPLTETFTNNQKPFPDGKLFGQAPATTTTNNNTTTTSTTADPDIQNGQPTETETTIKIEIGQTNPADGVSETSQPNTDNATESANPFRPNTGVPKADETLSRALFSLLDVFRETFAQRADATNNINATTNGGSANTNLPSNDSGQGNTAQGQQPPIMQMMQFMFSFMQNMFSMFFNQ
jgi:hypothetical protein